MTASDPAIDKAKIDRATAIHGDHGPWPELGSVTVHSQLDGLTRNPHVVHELSIGPRNYTFGDQADAATKCLEIAVVPYRSGRIYAFEAVHVCFSFLALGPMLLANTYEQ